MDEKQTELVLRSLDSEPVKNLLGPVTKELGLSLGDLAGLVRFYVNDNLSKVFTKWARQRNNQPLGAADIRRVIPLLQAASLQSDNELQERWAALLESTIATHDGVLPSFGQTMAQLTVEEAKYLERLFMRASTNDSVGQRELGDLDTVLDVYDPELRISYNTEARGVDSEAVRIQTRVLHAKLLLQDLERLGLIVRNSKAEQSLFETAFGPDIELKTVYALSEYGFHFIHAVTPKSPPAAQP